MPKLERDLKKGKIEGGGEGGREISPSHFNLYSTFLLSSQRSPRSHAETPATQANLQFTWENRVIPVGKSNGSRHILFGKLRKISAVF